MMNKKGIWGTLGKVAIVIAILGFLGINEIWELIPQINIIPDKPVDNNKPNPIGVVPFDFSKTTIIDPIPIKQNMYSNSNNIICYGFNNPTAEIEDNFTLIGEWFINNSLEPLEPEYEIMLNYTEIINQGRLNWIFINDSGKVKFRVALKMGVKPISKEVVYDLIDSKDVEDYLKKDAIISWNDSIIGEVVKQVPLCSKTNDEELAEEIMGFVRNYMSPPAKTEDNIYYDNITLNSIEAWNNKIGTSSEYSVVYAMLLRSVGIPARMLVNPNGLFDYYFTEVYLDNAGWIPVDVYDNKKSVGDLFEKEILELRNNYHYITLEGLDDIEFISLNVTVPLNKWISSKGIIRSNSNQKIEYLEVNISLLDENYHVVSSDWKFLIGSEGLEPNNQTFVELNSFPDSLNDIKYINLSKLK